MKYLENILSDIEILQSNGELTKTLTNVCLDSRLAKQGSLFVAIEGLKVDGHDFINQAITNGSTSIVCQKMPRDLIDGVTYVTLEDTQSLVGQIASSFYDFPTSKMQVIGVTGTNGKTTIATLLYEVFSELGFACGLVSTVQNRIKRQTIPSDYTTPDAVGLQTLFYEMYEHGCDYVFMEVSSHAIHQKRIGGIDFAGGIFSNITRDHLNYHGTFKEYIRVKKMFFDQLNPESFALSNADDKNGKLMLQNTKAICKLYSLRALTDYKAKVIQSDFNGMLLDINGLEFYTPLLGDFNAYNTLAVFGAAEMLGIEKESLLVVLSSLESVEGRFDVIRSKSGKMAIVDYAHTPDALENVLETIRKVDRRVHLITVVGCGGDRDKGKRPMIAKIGAKLSDILILTSDNPRSENPDDIIADMLAGIEKDQLKSTLVNSDRKQAIKNAIMMARKGSVILVAGKGHEKYQEIKGQKIPFDDKQILKALLLEDI